MRVLFCNIAWMSYYKGNIDGKDTPQGGGSYVAENQDAYEKFNFLPTPMTFKDESLNGDYCLGFVETKSTNKTDSNQLALEKIDGCQGAKNDEAVEDVLVIYCARYPFSEKRETLVVGWYKHADVYRRYEEQDFLDDKGNVTYVQAFNAFAKKEDCVLLPTGVRRRGNTWVVPRKNDKYAKYGFGQSNVWFANDPSNEALQVFLKRIIDQIENYDGINWIDFDGSEG